VSAKQDKGELFEQSANQESVSEGARQLTFAELDATPGPASANGAGAAVLAARAAAAAHADRTRAWTAPLFVEHQRRVANPVQLELRRRIRGLAESFEKRTAGDAADLDTLPAELDAELRALALDLRAEIVGATDGLLRDLADSYGLERPGQRAAEGATDDPPIELPSVGEAPDDPSRRDPARGVVTAGSLARGALFGRSLAVAMGPMGLLLGAAVGGLALAGGEWARRRGRNRQATQALVARAVETARIEIDADLRARLLDAQQLVQSELRLLVEQRARTLNEELARCEQAAAQDAEARSAAGELARRRLERTAPLRASAESMCRQAEELAAPMPRPMESHR
jgi:hypothetical protein